jgi:hypothetical protein
MLRSFYNDVILCETVMVNHSISHNLGHYPEVLHGGYDYFYAKFIFKLLSGDKFDPNRIFFHSPHRSRSSTRSTSTWLDKTEK